jgi:hypothetical protein
MRHSLICLVFILTLLSSCTSVQLNTEQELQEGQTSTMRIRSFGDPGDFLYNGSLEIMGFDSKEFSSLHHSKLYTPSGDTITAGPHSVKLLYRFDSPEYSVGELLLDSFVFTLTMLGTYGLLANDLPGSKCIGTISFSAEAGRQYMIRAIHDTEGLPVTLSIIQYEGNEEVCEKSKSMSGEVESCIRTPLVEGNEVTNTQCNVVE